MLVRIYPFHSTDTFDLTPLIIEPRVELLILAKLSANPLAITGGLKSTPLYILNSKPDEAVGDSVDMYVGQSEGKTDGGTEGIKLGITVGSVGIDVG
jgi:hypothetical protein